MENKLTEIKSGDCSTCYWLDNCFKDAMQHRGDSEWNLDPTECESYTPIFDEDYERIVEYEYTQSLEERHAEYEDMLSELND